jgi:sugar phosphate permease
MESFSKVRLLRVLLVTWLGYCGYTMARRPFTVARSEIQQETGLTKMQSGNVDTAFLIAYTVGQLMYGSYVKGRTSSRNILIIGLVGSALCCLLVSSVSSPLLFMLFWGANGAFQAAGWAACMSLLTPWLGPSERGSVMGIWGTNMAAGGILGNVVTSYLIGAGLSWRVAVEVDVCILIAISVVMWLLLVPHPNAVGLLSPQQAAEGMPVGDLRGATFDVEGQVVANKLSAESTPKPAAAAGMSMLQTLSIPGIRDIGASYFCHKLVRYCLMFWLPYYLNTKLKYNTSTAGYVSSVLDVGGVLGSVVAGLASDWYGNGRKRAQSLFWCVAGMFVSIWAFVALEDSLEESVTVTCFVVFCVGLFSFAIDSLLTTSYLQDYCDRIGVLEHMGPISGLIGGLGSAGSIAQGGLTVALSNESWTVLYTALAALTALAGALMWRPIKIELSQNAQRAREEAA